MKEGFVFQIIDAPDGLVCKCCPMPAEFLAGYVGLVSRGFCRICITPFVLQSLKIRGASLRAIQEGFLELSSAFDGMARDTKNGSVPLN